MTKLLATAALATLLASPAFAATVHKQQGPQAASHAAQTTPYGRTEGRSHSTNPANDVYDSAGNYKGSDPDARVRLEIMREGATD
jgi:opacity protein-like surface antigen